MQRRVSTRLHRALAVGVAMLMVAAIAPPAFSDDDPAAPASDAATGFAPGRVLVKFHPGSDRAAEALAENLGAAKIDSIPRLGVDVWRLPEQRVAHALDALSHSPAVEYAERDAVVVADETTPNDPTWPNQWSQKLVNAPRAWDSTTGDPATVIAELDTGVDFTHLELQGAFVQGTDIVNGDADPSDDHGHGTRVAGTLAARSNNGSAIASYCWNCKIMPVKVMSASGTGYMSDVASGIIWATDHGARVISMSLSGTSGTTTLKNAVVYATQSNVVLVAAAGNNGDSTPRYPAAYAEVIGVAGTNSIDALYSWSNYGSWASVAAPGCNYGLGFSGWYGNWCGTSSATPAVAGVVGLAVSFKPSASGIEIRNAIESSAVNVGNIVAHGRIDAAAALVVLGGTSAPQPAPSEPAPAPSPSPTPTTEPSPTQSQPPAPSTSTASFSGTFNRKHTTHSFTLVMGAGNATADLSFTQAKSLTLTLKDASGTVISSASGASVVRLISSIPASGTYQYVVGTSSKGSFTLTITHANP